MSILSSAKNEIKYDFIIFLKNFKYIYSYTYVSNSFVFFIFLRFSLVLFHYIVIINTCPKWSKISKVLKRLNKNSKCPFSKFLIIITSKGN